jgi:predicted butyrate kinase (DUF1464 family)
MRRVIGIDPGTVTIDICGLDDGQLTVDVSLPTTEALASPETLVRLLRDHQPDLIAGPSGYGLPLTRLADVDEAAIRLAYLAPAGERGGIGGLRGLAAALADADLPVLITPGVVHLRSVPTYRKVNRVDLGTADKVCVAALGIHDQAKRRDCALSDVSFILLELGGAFSAALAVHEGQIVDGMGGTAGPLGFRAAGALDGEVAFLAEHVPKAMLFRGGVSSIVGDLELRASQLVARASPRIQLAWDAFIESSVKAVATLQSVVPRPFEILLSGRLSHVEEIARELHLRLSAYAPVRRLEGFASRATEAAQGAALIADGLTGGTHQGLSDTLGIREAGGTALDNLYIISPSDARRRLGLV